MDIGPILPIDDGVEGFLWIVMGFMDTVIDGVWEHNYRMLILPNVPSPQAIKGSDDSTVTGDSG